jgi:chalcone isomerase-like protein
MIADAQCSMRSLGGVFKYSQRMKSLRIRLSGVAGMCVATGLAVAVCCSSVPAAAEEHQPLPPVVNNVAPGLHRRGTGRHTIFGIPIFDASLWIVGTQYTSSEPHAVDLEPSVPVPPSKLVGEIVDEMGELKAADDAQCDAWRAMMLKALPSLNRGDQLVILVMPSGTTIMYFNGQEREKLDDPNFGPALFRVWLDPASSYQHIKKGMLQE